MRTLTIRPAKKEDCQAIFDLIMELAIYEKGEDKVSNTPEQLANDGFSENPLFYCLLGEVDGEIVGMSLYYFRYSTWKGKVLYLEDLIVTESARGNGYGKELFETTIKKAKEENCNEMQWQVLDWNTPAIEFYKRYPVIFDDSWESVYLVIH